MIAADGGQKIVTPRACEAVPHVSNQPFSFREGSGVPLTDRRIRSTSTLTKKPLDLFSDRIRWLLTNVRSRKQINALSVVGRHWPLSFSNKKKGLITGILGLAYTYSKLRCIAG
jgi:hypothetical protein